MIISHNQILLALLYSYHIADYFWGGNISRMHCGITFCGENFHEWLNPHAYEALNKNFTGKLLINWANLQNLQKNSPSKITCYTISLSLICSKFTNYFFQHFSKSLPITVFIFISDITYCSHIVLFALLLQVLTSRETCKTTSCRIIRFGCICGNGFVK